MLRRTFLKAAMAAPAVAKEAFGKSVSSFLDSVISDQSAQDGSLTDRIHQLVSGLPYPDEISDDLIDMLQSWRTDGIYNIYEEYRNLQNGRSISPSDVATGALEELAISNLGQAIKSKIQYKLKIFELPDVIESKQANCLGYTIIFYILGNAMGLKVSTAERKEDHLENIVTLADNTLKIVDLTQKEDFITDAIVTNNNLDDSTQWRYRDNKPVMSGKDKIHINTNQEFRAEIFLNRGISYYDFYKANKQHKQKALKLATVCFDKALANNPDCEEAYNNRGAVKHDLGKHKEALKDFHKAIAIRPRYADAHVNIGNVYLNLEDYKEAREWYYKALDIDTELKKVHYYLAVSHINCSEFREAITECTKELAINKNHALSYFVRGVCYHNTKKTKEAKRDFDIAARLNPELRKNILRTFPGYISK